MAARRKNVNRLLDPRWGIVGGELRLWDRESPSGVPLRRSDGLT